MPRPTQVPSGSRCRCRVRGCHPLWPAFPCRSANRPLCNSHVEGPTTPQRKPLRFGLFPFRSPLLRESIFLSIPPVTEMFQFAGLAARHLWIQCRLVQGSRNCRSFVSSSGLFADFHALLRLLMPRHPPCALNSLTTNIQSSWILVQQADSRSLPSRPRGSAPTWPKSSSEDAIYTTTVLPKIKRRPSTGRHSLHGSREMYQQDSRVSTSRTSYFLFLLPTPQHPATAVYRHSGCMT